MGIFKKSNPSMEVVDIETGFNLWNLLIARYESLESAQMLKNFVHDRDLEIILNTFIGSFNKQIAILEEEVEKLQILAPPRPALEIKTSVTIDEITDKYIYKRTSSDMLAELFSLARSVRTTLTSDRLRGKFSEFLFSHLVEFEALYKYGKLKGWEEIAPAYKTTKPQGREQLSVSDAYHIWDHIQKRYHQIHLTMFYEGFVHDIDFRISIALARNILEAQLDKLEKLALTYEVPLPERPPASTKFAVDPEPIEDRFIFQQLFNGVDNMVDAHIRASIEVLRNDAVRKLFVNLLKDELDIHNNMIKYGKLKGWLIVPPIYAQGTVG